MGAVWVGEERVSRCGTRRASAAAVLLNSEGWLLGGEEMSIVERRSSRLWDWRNGEVVTIVLRRGLEGRGVVGSPWLLGRE